MDTPTAGSLMMNAPGATSLTIVIKGGHTITLIYFPIAKKWAIDYRPGYRRRKYRVGLYDDEATAVAKARDIQNAINTKGFSTGI